MSKRVLKKRWVAFLLSLTMIVTMLPSATAWAADTKADTVQKTSATMSAYEINPLYRDIVSLDDLEEPSVQGVEPQAQAPSLYSADTVYDSIDDAAACLLQNMENRQTEISFVYRSTVIPTENDFYEIFNKALEHGDDPSGGDYMRWGYARWTASASYQHTNTGYDTTFTYKLTYYTSAAQEAVFCQQAAQLCSDLGLDSDSLTDYEKVQVIYDYICSNITYDYANLNDSTYLLKHTAYAALINKTAVCQGYAQLFYWMALHSGLDARIVPNADHGWNIVKVGNLYYHLDSTWDAPRKQMGYAHLYFLKGSQDFEDHTFNAATYDVVNAYTISNTAFDGNGPADYSKVDQALESIPSDLTIYTDESVAAVEQAKNSVVRGKKVTEQASVNAMAEAIRTAVANLKLKHGDGLADTPENGIWYYYKNGKVATDVTTVAQNSNGWFYVKDGKVDFSYSGYASNSNGWWYVQGGCVDFSVDSVIYGSVNGEDAWWHVTGSQVVYDTTVAENVNGWWRIENGKVNFSCNSVECNANGWWYIRNGQVDFSYYGIASNANGWWKIEGGQVNFNRDDVAEGMVNGETGWWHIKAGQVVYDTTVASNANGWWYIRNGQVDFSYYGIASNANGWWKIEGGQVNFSFTGIAQNENGWWYLSGGKVDFGYNGNAVYQGRTYWVTNGSVA